MRSLHVAALAATLTAGAVASGVHALRGGRRTIANVRSVLYGPAVATSRPRAPLFAPLASRLDERDAVGLRLVALSASDVVARIGVSFVGGTLIMVLSTGTLMSVGALPPSPWWIVTAVAVGAAAAWVMWSDVQQRIVRRRRELQRAVNDFVQLVAVGLTTDQSVEEAVRFSLAVADEGAFDLLRAELETAPQRGVPLWDALDRLGRVYDQRELSELASSIERQGTQGVAITDTVASMAASMRAKALDELERDADKVNANLAGPTTAFVFTVVVFLAYPLAIRITEAFGG